MRSLGIPNLLKKAPKAIAITLLGNLLNSAYDFFFPGAKWGIYAHGSETLLMGFNSVVEMAVTGESVVSDYVIETGSFESYNKVEMPNTYNLRMSQDGSLETRSLTLDWLSAQIKDTELFDILTPEKVWQKVTLISFKNNRNSDSGAAMLVVDCIFQEIREKDATYSNNKTAKAENKETTPTVKTSPVETRTVQATALPPL